MKRIILTILAFAMLFTLTACGDSDEIALGEGLELAGRDAGNEAVQYSFGYPEEWEICRNDGVIELQYDCIESEMTAMYATISILSFDLSDANQTANSYWEQHEKEVQSIYTDYKYLDTEEYNEEGKMLDDSPALKVKYSGKINDRAYVNEQVICCRYGSVYLITLVVPEEYSDKVVGALDAVINNFKFA